MAVKVQANWPFNDFWCWNLAMDAVIQSRPVASQHVAISSLIVFAGRRLLDLPPIPLCDPAAVLLVPKAWSSSVELALGAALSTFPPLRLLLRHIHIKYVASLRDAHRFCSHVHFLGGSSTVSGSCTASGNAALLHTFRLVLVAACGADWLCSASAAGGEDCGEPSRPRDASPWWSSCDDLRRLEFFMALGNNAAEWATRIPFQKDHSPADTARWATVFAISLLDMPPLLVKDAPDCDAVTCLPAVLASLNGSDKGLHLAPFAVSPTRAGVLAKVLWLQKAAFFITSGTPYDAVQV